MSVVRSDFDDVDVFGAHGERFDERVLEKRFAALDEAYLEKLPKRAARLVRNKAAFVSVLQALRDCGWNATNGMVSETRER